jgi:hypothetical protein
MHQHLIVLAQFEKEMIHGRPEYKNIFKLSSWYKGLGVRKVIVQTHQKLCLRPRQYAILFLRFEKYSEHVIYGRLVRLRPIEEMNSLDRFTE